jgi:hypothetical protein
MGTTERIVGHLPPTFAPFPPPTALNAIVDAVGRVLQAAENELAELMKAHWLDHADRGRAAVRDLDLLAALVGLRSWEGEDVEWFRDRLARHVRSLFAGTVTIPGVLRVAADVLGEGADVDHLEHPGYLLRPDPADAGPALLGFRYASVRGTDATPAVVRGLPGLGAGVDLRATPTLRLEIDGTSRDVGLAAAAADPSAVRPAEIRAALDAAFGTPVATEDGDTVEIRSAATGSGAAIGFSAAAGVAADPVFGVAARLARGADASAAVVTGTAESSAPLDLRDARFLRLAVDGVLIREIELLGADQASVTPTEISAAIDAAFGAALTGPGPLLVVTSPSTGAASTVAVEPAAAQDAAPLLFGPEPYGVRQGADARPARIAGRVSLSGGADLSTARRLAVRVGDGEICEIDCAGDDPAHTKPGAVVDLVNAALGAAVASHDGGFVTLTGPPTGAASRIEVLTADSADAAEAVLGLRPTRYTGGEATAARLRGATPLRLPLDLSRQNRIWLRIDGGPALDVAVTGADPEPTAAEIAAAIDGAAGAGVASIEGDRLVLTSPTAGAASEVRLVSRLRVQPVRHVTRAGLTGEADAVLLGRGPRSVRAVEAGKAVLRGSVDLDGGADLRERAYLRLAVDGGEPRDVDCRGPRPGLTTAAEVVAALEAAFGAATAAIDAGRLVLTSSLPGPAGRILASRSAATDAAGVLVGGTAAATGTDATEVRFTGTRDLSSGLPLGAATLLRIGVDGALPVQLDLADEPSGPAPASLDGGAIAGRINAFLGQSIATFDGYLLTLASPATGAEAGLEFAVPDDPARDATSAVLGIDPPRSYHGVPATPASLTGTAVLPAVLDLQVRRHLLVALDGSQPVDLDCAGPDPAATTPEQVTDRINAVLGAAVAGLDAGRLRLTSTTDGAGSAVSVGISTVADARDLLLGTVPDTTAGSPARPAELPGGPALPGVVDLSARGVLRIAVDDLGPVDVAVAGATPARTAAAEVVAAINDALPAGVPAGIPVAALSADDRLVLTGASRVTVLPPRTLTLFEHPALPVPEAGFDVVQGTEFAVTNPSTSPEPFRLGVVPVNGVRGLTLRNLTVPATITVPGVIGRGERLDVALVDGVPAATVDGRPVPIELWPTASAMSLPAGVSTWRWTCCDDSRFDLARFERAWFAGGTCTGPGIFDLSRFAARHAARGAIFFGPGPATDAAAGRVTFGWTAHRPGSFRIELPWDLAPEFGGRFAGPGDTEGTRFHGPDEFTAPDVVLQPSGAAGSVVHAVNAGSGLLTAEWLPQQPPGVVPVHAPWPVPVRLTGGGPGLTARLFVVEDALGGLVCLGARTSGAAGNRIEVTLAAGGAPGRYALTVGYAGEAVFEIATERVRTALTDARAAGIGIGVDRTRSHD